MEEQNEPADRQTVVDRALQAFRSWRRSDTDRWLGGVCGGVAAELAIPPLLVRAIAVLAALVGVGIPLYVAAWVLTPRENGDQIFGSSNRRDIVGLAALGLSGLMLIAGIQTIDVWSSAWRLAPWLLILGGVALVLRKSDNSGGSGNSGGQGHPVEPAQASQAAQEHQTVQAHQSGQEHQSGQPPQAAVRRQPVRPPRVRPLRPKPFVGPLTMLVAMAVGLLLFALRFAGVETLHPGVIGSVLLLILGGGLLATAWRGRAHVLAVAAFPLVVVLGTLTVAGVRPNVVGASASYEIARGADLQSTYEMAAGTLELDLARLQLNRDREVHLEATAGDIRIFLPPRTSVQVEAAVGIGDIEEVRPDLGSIAYIDPTRSTEMSDRDDPPMRDDLVAEEDLTRYGADQSWQQLGWADHEFGGIAQRYDHRFGPASANDGGPVLTISIRLGFGRVSLFEPRWIGELTKLIEPTQVCTVGGGERGIVKPCRDIDEGQRVATCTYGYGDETVYDCRELDASSPVSLACLDPYSQYAACADVGVDPTVIGPPWVGTSFDGAEATVAAVETIAPVDPTTTLKPTTTTLNPTTTTNTTPTASAGK